MAARAETGNAQEQAGFLTAFKRPSVRILAASRGASKLAQATVSYGAMVYLASAGNSQWQVSLVAASTYFAAVLFGLQGGVLADSLSKRIAIVVGYIALAALCIFVPLVFGTGATEFIVIMFVSSALMQVVSPSLKSVVALVSNSNEMATVATSVSIVGSIASAIGSSLLAPILIKTTNAEVLLYVAAGIYLLGAIRTYRLPVSETSMGFGSAMATVDWHPNALSRRHTAEWLAKHRSVGATILVGAIVVSLFEAFNTLIPVYVRDVLDSDPTNAVYIFAPAGIGFLIGMFATPKLIRTMGARELAVIAAVVMSMSMILFGFIDVIAPVLAPFSLLRLVGWLFNIEINDKVLAASLIAVPANFGSTAAGASVQAYINSKVPIVQQGATFGFQEVQENVFTLLIVLLLGGISSLVGSRLIFVISPLVAIVPVIALIRYSFHVAGTSDVTGRAAFKHLVNTADPEPNRSNQMESDLSNAPETTAE